MNDMRSVIIPKSDQINADDLIGGPKTITITDVSIRPGTEQPVSIRFDGDGGKPYKPSKSMCRVMVNCWGPDASVYVGRSMTLYRDPKIKWGGMEVGGIRISHMTDIKATTIMALTETRGNKKPHTVQVLRVTLPPAVEPQTETPQQPRRTVRDVLAAIDARIRAGAPLAEIEASDDVVLIRTKCSDAAKAELGALLSAAADTGPDGDLGGVE